jgi:serine/threonine-protein kinase ATR
MAQVESVISAIPQDLLANAAFRCKAFARALLNFEKRVVTLKSNEKRSDDDLQDIYERLHEIYADLDEPDGMEGISTKIVSPTLAHQIREHETTGRWTSAQSCWEVRLQLNSNDAESHIGLLKCLLNLGHYGTPFKPVDALAHVHHCSQIRCGHTSLASFTNTLNGNACWFPLKSRQL